MASWTRVVGILGTAIITVASCLTSSVKAAREQAYPVGGHYRLAIIFDPTILTEDRSKEIDRIVDRLAERIAEGPEHITIVAWLLSDGMIQRPAPGYERSFEFKAYAPTSKDHKDEVKQWFQEKLKPAVVKAWSDAHVRAKSNVAATCLITALYCLSNYLRSIQTSDLVSVVVVSDLLEVCNDWSSKDATINMERKLDDGTFGPDYLPTTAQASGLIDLSRLSRVTIVRAPSSHIRTPVQWAAIETAWQTAFRQLRARNDIKFYADVPDQIELFERH